MVLEKQFLLYFDSNQAKPRAYLKTHDLKCFSGRIVIKRLAKATEK
jgi:hypothetical protein